MSRAALLANLPVEQRRLGSTSVLEAGSGPPLVLLHGGIECGGVIWTPVVAELAASHRLVIPDVPGLGESEPVDRLDAATFGAWLRELIELTCDEEPAVVAHSLCGTLAARCGIGRPLVIYGTPGIGRYRMPLSLRTAAIRFALHPTQRNLERIERLAFHDLDALHPDWLGAFGAYMLDRARVPHVKRTMRQLVATCTKQVPEAELRRIAPELVWGRHDRFVPVELGQAAAARLGWRLHVIEDAGHVPHVERPEAFVGVLTQLVRRRTAAGWGS
jgi:pimeloyl-ACP methyl ester carboxylesterase